MKIHLSLRLVGDNLNHKEIIDSITTNFIYDYDDYSCFIFYQPRGTSDEYSDESYEEDFIVFIEENYEKLFKHDIRNLALLY